MRIRRKAADMKAVLVAAGLLAAAGPAFAQETPSAKDEKESVVVTADQRQETFEKQTAAEREAAEARRLFAEVREERGDRALACRAASRASHDYADAITEARQLAKDAEPQLQQRLETRIKGMTERRDGLEDMQDRLCKDAGMTHRPIDRGARNPGTVRRPR